MAARKFFVGGNFKMNPTTQSGLESLLKNLNQADLDSNTEVVIAPPTIYLSATKTLVRKDIAVSAQNCHFKESGAYTGEISPKQLVDFEIPYVVLGHSERRTLFGETSEIVAQKVRAALDIGLKVILCIGETLKEREEGKTTQVVETQLKAVVDVVTKESDWSNIVIAYEPVWAIGTGKVATTSQAQEAHVDIRAYLTQVLSIGETTRVIYGGSVTAANCVELARQNDVDGFLVGGASLKPEFVNIVNSRR
ncbi:triose phosphate isomerase [Amanita rubescens]|nr:triose phosphate isomerase [Amanita rubescens]